MQCPIKKTSLKTLENYYKEVNQIKLNLVVIKKGRMDITIIIIIIIIITIMALLVTSLQSSSSFINEIEMNSNQIKYLSLIHI